MSPAGFCKFLLTFRSVSVAEQQPRQPRPRKCAVFRCSRPWAPFCAPRGRAGAKEPGARLPLGSSCPPGPVPSRCPPLTFANHLGFAERSSVPGLVFRWEENHGLASVQGVCRVWQKLHSSLLISRLCSLPFSPIFS